MVRLVSGHRAPAPASGSAMEAARTKLNVFLNIIALLNHKMVWFFESVFGKIDDD